jgi:P4 family phage/plasmid primase-like protien
MIISYGNGPHDNAPTRTECTFEQLVAWLRGRFDARAHGPKEGPYLSFADYGGTDSQGRQGIRSYECLLGSYCVPLDLDLGQYQWTAEHIRTRLKDYNYIAWTSYSHAHDKPRWRIVVPVERAMSADEHRGTWIILASLFANDCGESSKDATRLNYLPGACANPEIAEFISGTGQWFPVQAPVADVGKADSGELTDEPVEGWHGPEDDDELIAYMLAARDRAADAFAPPGTPTRFEALWYGDAAHLSTRHPPKEPHQLFDHTAADLALANELAYFTGSHGTRCLALFERSALAQRDSYREDKGVRAITRACAGRTMHHFMRRTPAVSAQPQQAPSSMDSTTGVPSPIVAPPVPGVPHVANPEVIPDTNRLITDLSNANRLYKHYGAHLLSAAGDFYSWTGTHWQGGPRHPLRLGFNLSALIGDELVPMRERHAMLQGSGNLNEKQAAEWEYLDAMIPELAKWAQKSEQLHVVEAALRALKTLLDVPMTSFDSSPWLLNCRNGTVDLRTGELKAHDPADRITRIVNLDYLPDAECPRFERFLPEVFPDPATVDYVHRYFGYSITGSNREQTMLVHWGSGSNGKNTLLKAVRMALGAGYAMAGTAGLLTVDKEASMIHEIADLYGSRLVTIDETSDGARLNESSFKRVTGDDNVRGRHLYKSFFEYRPTYKLHLLTNHKPRVVNTDNGVWRRLRLLPYTQAFTAENGRIDKGLDEALEHELPGILAWLVRGAARWFAEGLRPCPEVAKASAEYRNEEDMLGQFVAERCALDPVALTPVAALYASYAGWARENGAFVMSKKRLVGDLVERPLGLRRVHKGDAKVVNIEGLKLLSP